MLFSAGERMEKPLLKSQLPPQESGNFLSSKVHQFLYDLNNSLRLKAKFPLEFLERGGGPKRLHPDDAAKRSDVALPAEGRCLLNGDAQFHRRRQHAVTVLGSLVVEDVPRWHRNNPRPNALEEQRLVGVYSQTHFTAGRNQNDVRISAARISKHIRPARHSRCRRVFGAIQSWKSLTR